MLAWVAYQRRADCMREYWGYNLHHILSPFGKHKVFKPLDYIFKGVKSFAILFRERPNVIWLQLPPSPLLYVAWIYRTCIDSNVKIVIDAHNSLMRSKWLNFPFTLRLLNQAHTFLAHNEAAANEFRRLGVNELKIRVLEDLPFQFQCLQQSCSASEPYAICPCSFDIDEPITLLFDAFRELNCNLYITGNLKKLPSSIRSLAPPNVKFTGFLSKAEYEQLINGNSLVIGLTTRHDVQLSVANEGLSAGRPLLLSDTPTLRSLYGDAALFFSTNSADSLRAVVSYALTDPLTLVKQTKTLYSKRIDRWKQQAASLGLK